MTEPKNRWRVGRTIGRSIYIQRLENPSKADHLIGMVDTQGLAEFICRCVNYVLTHDIDVAASPTNSPDAYLGEAMPDLDGKT